VGISADLLADALTEARRSPPRQGETTWAYVAAMLDGEGSINLILQNGFHRRAKCAVYQSGLDGKEMLDSLCFETSLGIVSPAKKSNIGKLPAFRWTIGRQVECFVLLTHVRPYLRLKQHAADAVLSVLKEKADLHDLTTVLDVWNKRKHWSAEDLDLLKRKYNSSPETVDELCHLLKRSRHALFMQAWKLGLTGPRHSRPRHNSGNTQFALIAGGHKQQKRGEENAQGECIA
jgi:hypothetical protein